MTTWVPSGRNWMWTTWVGDAQVIYLLEGDANAFTGKQEWVITRKVSGAKTPSVVGGLYSKLEHAKDIAEHDAQQLQEKGF